MDDYKAVVFCCIFVTDLRTAIRRAVIHQDNFQIGIGLIDDAVYASPQIRFNLVYRNDYGNERVWHGSNRAKVLKELFFNGVYIYPKGDSLLQQFRFYPCYKRQFFGIYIFNQFLKFF